MLAGEHAPRPAEAGGDLIEDEKRAVAVAGGAYACPEAGLRHVRHGSDRLGNERGDIALALEHVLDHARASVGRGLGTRGSVGAAIAAEGSDMHRTCHPRRRGTGAEQRLTRQSRRANARPLRLDLATS